MMPPAWIAVLGAVLLLIGTWNARVGKAIGPAAGGSRWFARSWRGVALPSMDTGLIAVLVICATGACHVLVMGLAQPISDMHEFRQTQTALSIEWIWRDGHALAYETPVLGFPWSIPFEFPVYQDLVVALRVLGIPIVVGGRLVSFAFLIGLLWPLKILFQAVRLSRTAYLVTGILLLSSPIHVFWGRTVMIETCAVFFGLAWLAFLARFLDRGRVVDGMIAAAFGVLATAAKITTFPPFGLLGGALFCWSAYQDFRAGMRAARVTRLLPAVGAAVLPIATGMLWVWFSDHVKEANPIGALLTSRALEGFNFGTWPQRIGLQLWHDVIWRRVLPDIMGYAAIVTPGLVLCAALSKRAFCLAVLSVAAFLLPFLLVTNLHIVHNYYQTANAIFLIAAVGIGIAAISDAGWPRVAVIVLLAVVAGQTAYFRREFAPLVTADYSAAPAVLIGAEIRRITTPDEDVLVFGADWSSAIPFYSERKSLVIPFLVTATILEKLLADPRGAVGGDRVGAIVECPAMMVNYADNQPRIEAFLAGRAVRADVAGCRILAPDR